MSQRARPCPGCGWIRNSYGDDVLCRTCRDNPHQRLPAEEVRRIAEAVEVEARKRFLLAMVYLTLSADMRRSA